MIRDSVKRMPLMTAYHRPTTVGAALELLSEPHRVALAGGTLLNADREPSRLEAVDLQALELKEIEAARGQVRLGAMATLDEMSRSSAVPERLRALARAEAPSTLRTLATVGGLVARRRSDSLLLAALLAHRGRVALAGPGGADEADLARVLGEGVPAGALITAVAIDPTGAAAVAAVGRTPADVPIVAAYGRRAGGTVTVALTGVAPVPVLADGADPAAGLAPEGDFRGSAEYRLELARVLARRVTEELAADGDGPADGGER